MNTSSLIQKVWNFCHTLRDDGVGYGDYLEQLTYLLFLKMAHERATRQLKPERVLPQEYSWQRLLDAQGDQIEIEYTRMLIGLARPLVVGDRLDTDIRGGNAAGKVLMQANEEMTHADQKSAGQYA